MKHILAILAVFSAFAFTVPSTAHADCGGRRVVSYTACGRPIYAHFEVYGYDRCGQAVGRWVTDWYNCSCSICNPRPRYDAHCDHDRDYRYPSHSSSHFYFGNSRSSCGSPFRSGGFYFSFGR